MKFLKILYKFVSYFPFLGIISFYLFVLRAYKICGHLPWYHNPYPYFLQLNFHYNLTGILILFGIFLTIIWFSFTIVLFIARLFKVRVLELIFGTLNFIIYSILIIKDPYGLFEWFSS